MALSPGTIVGGYRIERVLGAGGMGTVYLAKHPSLPRKDALKVLSADLSSNSEFRARFEREANLASGLDHPNIIAVFNRGEENGQLWISMQYVDGTDASASAAKHPRGMPAQRALRIISEVGKGLDFAHRKGLLHRDIKPANFLLSESEDEERIYLTDFGVAKATDDASELTQTGNFLATIAYAPPEQLTGQALDHRADIYSLACSLFKLLTGRNPYPAPQPAMVMMGHLYEPPPSATSVKPDLPAAIDHVFAKAMAKNPVERFNSCREFTDAAYEAFNVGRYPARSQAAPVSPVPISQPAPVSYTSPQNTVGSAELPAPAPRRRSGKKWPLAAGVGAVVVALVIGGGIWLAGDNESGGESAASAEITATQPPSVEQARADNPDFAGKEITIVDYKSSTDFQVFVTGTPQADFIEKLGFVYNFNFTRQGDEPPLRDPGDNFTVDSGGSDAYVIVVRSDAASGGGGLTGLPLDITRSRAQVIAVDDPGAVVAMRNWSENSEHILLEKMLPTLERRVN